jgi:hypothetical protein
VRALIRWPTFADMDDAFTRAGFAKSPATPPDPDQWPPLTPNEWMIDRGAMLRFPSKTNNWPPPYEHLLTDVVGLVGKPLMGNVVFEQHAPERDEERWPVRAWFTGKEFEVDVSTGRGATTTGPLEWERVRDLMDALLEDAGDERRVIYFFDDDMAQLMVADPAQRAALNGLGVLFQE